MATAEQSLAQVKDQLATSQERIGTLEGELAASDLARAVSQQRLASAEGSLLETKDCLKNVFLW